MKRRQDAPLAGAAAAVDAAALDRCSMLLMYSLTRSSLAIFAH